MKKKIEIIIEKSIGGGFFVYMRGHYENEKFTSTIGAGKSSYKEARESAMESAYTIKLLGNTVKIYNDVTTEKDSMAFCKMYALEPFETLGEKL